ncbi:MAG: [protein-PII] uridylyltransferase [Nitrospirae bacterium]|nr:[protein-PII] uridylyltransferase [Nitrospirota bacterium]
MNDAALTELGLWVKDGCNGLVLTGRLTSKIDSMIREVYENNQAQGAGAVNSAHGEAAKNPALVATGGYGRMEMAPYSDVDIMFLVGDRDDTSGIERILYSLWDTGLDISHCVRTPEDCLDEAFKDIRTRTSLLESRFICGNAGLFEKFKKDIYPEIAFRKQKDFVREKLRESGRRHLSSGSSVFLLEPHVKEGEGGLRDIHTAYWLSKVAVRTESYTGFFGDIGVTDRRRFSDAYEFLLRTRFCLHLTGRRKNDVLSYEFQRPVAEMLGFRDSSKFSATERMLRYYYLKGRTILDVTSEIVSKCSRPYVTGRKDMEVKNINDGFSISGGSLITTAQGLLRENPDRILEAFYLYGKTGRRFSEALGKNIRRTLVRINKSTRNSKKSVQHFLEVLKGGRVYETLRIMHETGVLGRFIPEFGALRMLVVHEPYHMYTVDEHTLIAIRNLEQLRTTSYKNLEDLHNIMNTVERTDILFLSLLLHDIGKAAGRHHEEEGYKRLKNITERFNFNVQKRLRIEFLVRNHILMSEMALKREASDIEVITRFAESVGDEENLKAIYLITYADMSAVNPGFWNSWKAYLLRELYLNTLDYLNGVGLNRTEYIKGILSNSRGADADDLQEFISGMPGKYLLSTSRVKILDDFRLFGLARETGFAVRIDSRSDGLVDISVSTADTPGLFSRIVGLISSRGLNIVNGRIFTGGNGLVIDKISVSNWQEVWWEGLAASLTEGLREAVTGNGHFTIRGRNDRVSSPFDIFVEIDNEASEEFTIIEVFSPDRLGLLYQISDVMLKNDIDISSARINTEAGLAQDIFYVQSDGRKLDCYSGQKVLSELWTTLKEE